MLIYSRTEGHCGYFTLNSSRTERWAWSTRPPWIQRGTWSRRPWRYV